MAEKKIFTLYRAVIHSFAEHKIILFPYIIIAFFQLFLIEILYFYPRYPLKEFFGPLVSKIWSPIYMHYPHNFVLLPEIYQNLQIPIFIIFSSFFICVSIHLTAQINKEGKASLGQAFSKTLPMYVYIMVAAMISFLLVLGLFNLYEIVYDRAELIRSESGKFYLLKQIIIGGRPYFNLLISIFVTWLMAYVFPIIVIERKNVFKALVLNFRPLFGSIFFTFFLVFIPSSLFSLMLVMRASTTGSMTIPEMTVVTLALSVVVMVFIDAVIYTALTTYYLAWKEDLEGSDSEEGSGVTPPNRKGDGR